MVASEDGDAGRVSDFEGNKESDCLDRVVTAIYVVTCMSSAKPELQEMGD